MKHCWMEILQSGLNISNHFKREVEVYKLALTCIGGMSCTVAVQTWIEDNFGVQANDPMLDVDTIDAIASHGFHCRTTTCGLRGALGVGSHHA